MCGFYFLFVGLLSVGPLQNVGADDHTYVKLPNDNVLMSLTDFEAQIVGKQMGEMYFGLAKPPAFAPDIHYKSTISKVPGSRNYTQVTIGETPGENSRCARGNQNLSPVHHDKAFFYNDDSTMRVQAIWSSDPSKYIWSMRCSNYRPGRRRCSFEESSFGLYVHGNLDDMPSTVFEDLCKATGLKFGSDKFKWTFTHGENTLC